MKMQLSNFVGIGNVRRSLKTKIEYYSTRPDEPTAEELNLTQEQKDRVSDLLNKSYNFAKTADGKHDVSEFVLQDDFWRGVVLPSPSVPLLFCLLPILAALTTLLFAVAMAVSDHIAILKIPLLLVASLPIAASLIVASSIGVSMATWKEAAVTWGVVYLAPILLSKFLMSGAHNDFAFVVPFFAWHISWYIGFALALVAGMLIFGLYCGLTMQRGWKATACQNGSQMILWMGAIAIAGSFMMQSGPLSVVAVNLPFLGALFVGPIRYTRQLWTGRARLLLLQSSSISSGSHLNTALMEVQKKEVVQKITMAAKDTSPVFEFGTSLGILYSRGSIRGLPAGVPCRVTMESLQTHMLIVGETKGGKSASGAIPLASRWMESGWGGVFVMDGKNELPLFFKGIRNFTLITEETSLSPFEGLEVDEVLSAILAVAGVDMKTQESGNGQHFKLSGGMALSTCVALTYAMSDAEKNYHALEATYKNLDGPQVRRWLINPDCLLRIVREMQNWTDEGGSKVIEYMDFIRKFSPDLKLVHAVKEDGTPTTVLTYPTEKGERLKFVFDNVIGIQATPKEERGSVMTTMLNWVLPMFESEKLLHWCKRETGGFNIEKLLYGASAGFYLPKDKFRDAGLIFQALGKQRLMACAKRRTKGWEARYPNQKPMMLMMDEYHTKGICSKNDAEFSSQCRSWGISMVILTQSIESIEEALGKDATAALIQNFKSKGYFRNMDSWRTMEYAIQTFGKFRPIYWKGASKVPFSVIKSVENAGNNPVFDTWHPDNKLYEKLQRLGAGQFTNNMQGFLSTKDAIGNDDAHKLSSHHVSRLNDSLHALLHSTDTDMVIGLSDRQVQDEFLVTEAMYSANLGSKGVMLFQGQRGGAVFGEFFKCGFMEYPPDHMKGPDTIPDSIVVDMDEDDLLDSHTIATNLESSSTGESNELFN